MCKGIEEYLMNQTKKRIYPSENFSFCIWDVGDTIYPYTIKPLIKWLESKSTHQNSTRTQFNFNPYMRGEVSFETFCKNICTCYEVPFKDSYLKMIDLLMKQGIGPIFKETRQAMCFLKEKGILNGILSNALPNLSHIKLGLPIEEKFIFTSFNFGLLKPDIAIYQRMQKEIGCQATEILFIDNKPQNVVAARQAGMNGIVYHKKSILSYLKEYIKESK